MNGLSLFLRRHAAFLRLALAGLSRRKWRFILLLSFYTLTVFWCACLLFLSRSLQVETRRILSRAPDLTIQRLEAGRQTTVPRDWKNTAAAIRGIRSVQLRDWGYMTDPVTGQVFVLAAAARADIRFSDRTTDQMPGQITDQASDPSLDPLTLQDDQAVAGRAVIRFYSGVSADNTQLWLADAERRPLPFRIIHVFPPSADRSAGDRIVVSPSAWRRVTGIPENLHTDLAITVGNPTEIPTIRSKLSRILPGSRIRTRSELLAAADAILDRRSGFGLVAFWGAMAACLGFFLLRMAGAGPEERKETGLLRALGWCPGDILRVRLWQGLAISVTAFLSGGLAATAYLFYGPGLWGADPLFSGMLKGWSVLYPEAPLPLVIHIPDLLALAFLTVVPFSLAAIFPGWISAVREPEDLLR